MNDRWIWILCGVIGLHGLGVSASEKPTDEYVEAMKALATVAQGMGPAIEADDHAAMNDLVIMARPALDVLQTYWMDRAVEDAIDLARAASKSISEISVAVYMLTLSPNPMAKEGAQLATKNLLSACTDCHAAHRERLPDGSYHIK